MDRAARADERLNEVSRVSDELRKEIRGLRDELRSEIRGLRAEVRGEFAMLRTTLIRVGGGIMAGLVGVIAAVLAGG